jgi:hypothetical protein
MMPDQRPIRTRLEGQRSALKAFARTQAAQAMSLGLPSQGGLRIGEGAAAWSNTSIGPKGD